MGQRLGARLIPLHRRDTWWAVGYLGGDPPLPVLFVDPTPSLYGDIPLEFQWAALGLTLVEHGFKVLETREGLGYASGALTIAGDHMEADWVGSGDPDTYEGLVGLEQWLGDVVDDVLVVIGAGAADNGAVQRGWAACAAVRRVGHGR